MKTHPAVTAAVAELDEAIAAYKAREAAEAPMFAVVAELVVEVEPDGPATIAEYAFAVEHAGAAQFGRLF